MSNKYKLVGNPWSLQTLIYPKNWVHENYDVITTEAHRHPPTAIKIHGAYPFEP